MRSLKILKNWKNQVHVPGLLLCNIICINMARLRQPYQMHIYSALRNFEFWARLIPFRAVSSRFELVWIWINKIMICTWQRCVLIGLQLGDFLILAQVQLLASAQKRDLSLEKRWSWMINWIKRGVIRREEAAFLGRFMQILIITANNKTPWIQVNIIFDRQNRQIQK